MKRILVSDDDRGCGGGGKDMMMMMMMMMMRIMMLITAIINRDAPVKEALSPVQATPCNHLLSTTDQTPLPNDRRHPYD